MVAPLLSSRRQIAIKAEAVAGTAETLAAADVILPTDIPEWDPDITVTPRNALTASLSPRGSVVGSRAAKIRWKQFLRGTDVAPVQDVTFPDFRNPFLGCGVKDTVSGVPVDEQTSFKPLTSLTVDDTSGVYMTVATYLDGKRQLIHGAVGNCVLTFTVGQMILAEFEFTGVYNVPTDVALLVPTYPTVVEPQFNDAALTILGYTTARLNSITLDFGNEIVMRPNPNDVTGWFTAQIARRNPTGSFEPEETLAATKDWHNEFVAGTTGLIDTGVFPAGGTNYNQLNFKVPKAKYRKAAGGDRDGLATVPIDYEPTANSDAGDDDWELIQT